MITRIENEIIELHQFFQDWYNNQLPSTEENFSRCADVLAPEFSIIFPSGDQVLCQPLLEKLHKAHGTHNNMRIWIENIQVLYHFDELALATYEEWQKIGEKVTARLSSVLFKTYQHTPNGLFWLHVHETWMNI
jgi:hypothetical protein